MQKRDLVDYAKARGWSITHIYEDKATGTNANRKDLKELQADARQRKFDVLLVWKLDRIFRSVKDCINGLHEFADLGVEFVSLKDAGIDMTTPSGKLLLHILAAFAEFEASIIRMRVKAGVQAKIARTGKWGPERKRNDKLIADLRTKGLSIRQIAKRLGISTATVMRGMRGVTGTLSKA